jgi:excisionase family DNA binding protein
MKLERVKDLYTVIGAAKALGVSERTVLRRIWAGKVSTIQVGRVHMVRLDDLRATIKRRYVRKG